MAVHVVAGVMGSGKSFESVKEKILPALKAGQRVVSNIAGLNHELIAKYLNLPEERVRQLLIVIDDDVITKDNFYPADENDFTSIVHPGDLLLLDEVWKFFPKGQKLTPRCMNFFRMHRHWSNPETGLTCEIVLCIQSIRGLHNDIRDVVEVRFQCRKMKVFGKPENYQVWLYEGEERKASHHFDRTYDKKIFPLYKSHASGGAVEQFDKRQSIYSKPFFKLVRPIAYTLIPLGAIGAWWSLHKLTHPKDTPSSVIASVTDKNSSNGKSAAQGSSAVTVSESVGKAWRIVASYTINGQPVFKLVDDNGRYRTLTPGAVMYGANGEVYIPVAKEDDRATPWSGSFSTYNSSTKTKQ